MGPYIRGFMRPKAPYIKGSMRPKAPYIRGFMSSKAPYVSKPPIQPCKNTVQKQLCKTKLYKKSWAKKLCNNDCESGRTPNWCGKFPHNINLAMQNKLYKKTCAKKTVQK